MKTHVRKLFTFISTAAAIFTTALAFPQQPKPPVPPEAPAPPAPAAEPLPAPPPAPAPPDLKLTLDSVRRQVDVARDQAAEAFSAAGDVFAQFAGGDQNFLRRAGGRPARSLVLPSSDMEPQSMATAAEDLNIMARILDKALPGRDDDKSERRAMGIAIFSPAGGSGAIRNLYLEGYGALFFLDVRFPLLPPPKKEDQNKPKEPTSSAWEEARSELYSPRGPRGDGGFGWKIPRGEAEEYDADKVEQLKESLLDAFRHATHIRTVKPDEWIAVVVSGGEPARMDVMRLGRGIDARELHVEAGGGGGGGYAGPREVKANSLVRRSPGPGESVLLIRARKSDVDALAKGKLDLEQFKKKATIRVY